MFDDHKTREDRLDTDWYILPLVLTIGVCAALLMGIEVYGPDRVIEIVASYF